MFKKMVCLAVVGFVVVAAVKGSKLHSYLRSEWEAMKEKAEASVPPEKEIARLRNEVKLLEKDLVAVARQLATENVEVQQLREKSDKLRAQQSQDKELLQSRATSIKNATEQVTFGDRTLTVAAAKAELKEGVNRYNSNAESLKAMDQAISNREKVRAALEKQVEALKTQRTELNAALDKTEADLALLKAQQIESKTPTDNTRLTKIKADLEALKKRIAIDRETLKILPSALEKDKAPAGSTESVDEIMAAVNGTPAKPATPTPDKMPVIE